jgi:hypothetical protein
MATSPSITSKAGKALERAVLCRGFLQHKQKQPLDFTRKRLLLLFDLVGTSGFEPPTPTMSRWCSNQLSYVPSMAAYYTV